MKRVALYIFLLLFLFTLGVYTHSSDTNNIKSLHSIFKTEADYFNYLQSNIQFKELKIHIVDIKRGDNFWKIAKKYNTSIDTLIAMNPYWHSLVAQLNQKIAVPTTKGLLHFIKNFNEIDILCALYKVTKDKVIIQKLPPLYKYYYTFKKKKDIIAVFIKDVKPKEEFLSVKIAKQYSLRKMFRSPLGGRLSSFYGNRRHPIFKKWGFHNGIDIAARYGTLVGAARKGKVIASGWMGGYGKAIIIQHDKGYRTLYGHLSRIFVRKGMHVSTGRLIGRVGSTGQSTGPHLHFTLWRYNKLINPLKVLW